MFSCNEFPIFPSLDNIYCIYVIDMFSTRFYTSSFDLLSFFMWKFFVYNLNKYCGEIFNNVEVKAEAEAMPAKIVVVEAEAEAMLFEILEEAAEAEAVNFQKSLLEADAEAVQKSTTSASLDL